MEMALTTPQTNNKLVKYRKEIVREFFRENPFSPYMGEDMTSIIRTLNDLKAGGEQINIPIVTRLQGTGKSTGTLTDNEEQIDNYGMRAYIDWSRNSVATNEANKQKDSADIFGEAKPLLSDWQKEKHRDEIIAAMMALPSESAPANLGSDEGQCVNGILYADATATQKNTWTSDNSDRVLFGNALGNYSSTHATALGNVDTSADTFTTTSIELLKYVAKRADPRIRPFQTKKGGARQYYVAFCGSNNFRQISASLQSIDIAARPREGSGMDDNPIYQDGDLLYKGVIIHEVPEIDDFVDNVWTTLLTAGNSSSRVAPVFLCGQSAVAFPWGQMTVPTFRETTDYQFVEGVGIKSAYGLAKIFKKHPINTGGTKLVQFGMVTGFFSAANPS